MVAVAQYIARIVACESLEVKEDMTMMKEGER